MLECRNISVGCFHCRIWKTSRERVSALKRKSKTVGNPGLLFVKQRPLSSFTADGGTYNGTASRVYPS